MFVAHLENISQFWSLDIRRYFNDDILKKDFNTKLLINYENNSTKVQYGQFSYVHYLFKLTRLFSQRNV